MLYKYRETLNFISYSNLATLSFSDFTNQKMYRIPFDRLCCSSTRIIFKLLIGAANLCDFRRHTYNKRTQSEFIAFKGWVFTLDFTLVKSNIQSRYLYGSN